MSTKNYDQYLSINTAYDNLLDPGVSKAASEAMQSVDSETVTLFTKYKMRLPGDFTFMSWKSAMHDAYETST